MGYENKSVVEIETIKTEINFLLKAYKDTLDNYISNLRNQLNDKASNDLSNLNEINETILVLLSKGKNLMNEYYNTNKQLNKGNDEKNTFLLFDKQLSAMSHELKLGETQVKNLHKEVKSIQGENESARRNIASNRLKYVIMTILFLLVAFMIIRVLFLSKTNVIDTLFLISAVSLGAFHFFNKQA